MITLDDIGSLPVTMTIPEYGEQVHGLSRGSSYAAARRGDIPTIRIGHRLMVPVARALAQTGITPSDSSEAPPASDAHASTSSAQGRRTSPDDASAQHDSASNAVRVDGL